MGIPGENSNSHHQILWQSLGVHGKRGGGVKTHKQYKIPKMLDFITVLSEFLWGNLSRTRNNKIASELHEICICYVINLKPGKSNFFEYHTKNNTKND